MSGIHCTLLENPDFLLFQVSSRLTSCGCRLQACIHDAPPGESSWIFSGSCFNSGNNRQGHLSDCPYIRFEISPSVTTNPFGNCRTISRVLSALSRASFMKERPLPRVTTERATSVQDLLASGNRSSGSGGCPPSRNKIRCAASASAPARRSAKKRSVRIAASFSARATTTNWLMLVPSSRLTSATAFLSERGSLNGYEAVCFMVQSLSTSFISFIPSCQKMPLSAPGPMVKARQRDR